MQTVMAVERGLVRRAVAKTGRAYRGAIAAGETTLGHFFPAWMREIRKKVVAQIARGQAPDLPPGGVLDFPVGLLLLSCCCRCERPWRGQRASFVAAGLHQITFIRFMQGQIETLRGARPVAGGYAETGVGGMRAMDHDKKKIPAPRGITGVGERTLQKVPVLKPQGGEVAGTHADNGEQLWRGIYF